jgi:hypothetical protein
MVSLVAPALLFAACGGKSHPTAATATSSATSATAVTAQPVSTPGANPFTPAVGKDTPGVTPPPAATRGLAVYTANLPGLYAGTPNYATCDAQQLVRFLAQSPTKLAAWTSALRIQPARLRSYLRGLTPVTLRTDTRVTDHAFVDRRANPSQMVFEAGTAVLVDGHGEPVVKCYSGNPLTPAGPSAAPVYTGPLWTGFTPADVATIRRSLATVKVFKLYDPDSGEIFARPAATTGRNDGRLETAVAPTITPSGPTQTAPTSTAPTRRNPQATIFSSGGTHRISVSGFPADATLSIALTRPDGAIASYTIGTDAAGNGTYVFPHGGDLAPGAYSARITDPQSGDTALLSITVTP